MKKVSSDHAASLELNAKSMQCRVCTYVPVEYMPVPLVFTGFQP